MNNIITTPEAVARVFADRSPNDVLVAISGAFAPLHGGHTSYLQAASMLKGKNGLLVVIVNGDGFLERKYGRVFMPISERLNLIAAMKGVDFVVPWDDGSQTVSGALKIIKPKIFAKGAQAGWECDTVPEKVTCDEIGCALVMGIGGSVKIQSSMNLINNVQHYKDLT